MIDNHFGVPDSAVDYLKPPKEFPLSQIKFSLTRLSLVWQVMLMMMMVMIIIMMMIIKVFGGNDFSNSKEMRSNTKSKLEQLGMSMTVPMVDPANKKEKKRDAGCPLVSVRKVQHKKKFKTISWIKNVFFLKALSRPAAAPAVTTSCL